MSASKYVCRRCGMPVVTWREGWKHAGGQHLKMATKHAPDPALRSEVEADASAAVAAMRRHVGNT